MSESVYAGLTSQSVDLFLADSSSTTGAGLTGVVYNAAGLTCYYRKGATGTAAVISLASVSVGGAWQSGGFVEVDSTNMPGIYRFDIPNTVVDSEGFVTIYFQGATNLVPTALRIDCRPIPSDIKKVQADSASATSLKSLVDTDFEARTIPSGEYFNWAEDADFSSLQTYIDGRTIPSGDYFDSALDSVNLGAILGTSLTESNAGNIANNVKQFYDVNPTTTNTVNDVGSTGSSPTASEIADAVWDEQLDGHMTPGSAGESLKYSNLITASGTVEYTPTNTVFATSVGDKPNTFYHDSVLSFLTGDLAGQSRVVTSYSATGGFGTFGFDEPFTTAPASGDVFGLYRGHMHSSTQIAGEVWERAVTIPVPIDSYGAALLDVPNNSEFQDRTIPSGEYFNSSEDSVNISASSRASLVDDVWDEQITNSVHSGAQTAGKYLRQANTIIAADGQVQDASPGSGEFVISLDEPYDDFYSNQAMTFTSGALTGQSKIIDTYNGTTKTVTFDEPFSFAPASGDEFSIIAQHIHTASDVAYQVYEQQTSGHNTAGSFGAQFNDVSTSVTAIEEDTSTTIPALINALTDIDSDTVKAAVASIVVEAQGSYTVQQALSVILSVLAGQSTDNGLTFKTPNGSATRVAATVDENKNRTNMDITPSS